MENNNSSAAILSALDNIHRAINLKKTYTAGSVDRFSKNKPNEYKELCGSEEPIKEPIKWMAMCLTHPKINDCQETRDMSNKVRKCLMEKNYQLAAKVQEQIDLALGTNSEDPNSSISSEDLEKQLELHDAVEEQHQLRGAIEKLTEQVSHMDKRKAPSRKEVKIENLRNASQNVVDWFKRFENQTQRWTDEDRGLEVACFFEDLAFTKYDLMVVTEKHDYNAIKKSLIKAFQPKDFAFTHSLNFQSAKQQPGESVLEFGCRLLKMIGEAEDKDREELKGKLSKVFRSGCCEEIRQVLVCCETEDFEKLWDKAKEIEPTNKKEEVAAVKSDTSQAKENIKRPITCYKCNKNGHIARDCREYTAKATTSKSPAQPCWFCGGKNHYTADCRKLKEKEAILRTSASKPEPRNNNYSKAKVPECSFCHNKGHREDKCWHKLKKCDKCGMTGHQSNNCRQTLNQ